MRRSHSTKPSRMVCTFGPGSTLTRYAAQWRTVTPDMIAAFKISCQENPS